MKYLDKKEIETIDSLMYNKALDVDVALYNYEFDNSTTYYVLTSLYLYKNEDGGFGHSLSLDNLNPNSLVYETYEVFKILKSCNIIDGNQDETVQDIVFPALNYLWKQDNFSSKDKSNNDYACAIRFKGEANNDLFLGIIGYTLLLSPKGTKYYKKAIELAQSKMDYILNISQYDYFTLEQYKIFLIACLMKNEFSDKFEEMQVKFNTLLTKFLETSDLNKDYFEVLSILEDFDLSDSEQKILDDTLDILVDKRESHGMWQGTHTWGNEDKYPEAMSSDLKWFGRATRLAIHYLNKFNRIK